MSLGRIAASLTVAGDRLCVGYFPHIGSFGAWLHP